VQRQLVAAISIAGLVVGGMSCSGRRGGSEDILLADRLASSRRQPIAALFSAPHGPNGSTSIRAPLNARITFNLLLPGPAWFRADVDVAGDRHVPCVPGLSELFSVGVSDGHVFRELGSARVTCGADGTSMPASIEASLREYEGLAVGIVLNTRVSTRTSPGASVAAVWRHPAVRQQ
jgi:hypothetical protein